MFLGSRKCLGWNVGNNLETADNNMLIKTIALFVNICCRQQLWSRLTNTAFHKEEYSRKCHRRKVSETVVWIKIFSLRFVDMWTFATLKLAENKPMEKQVFVPTNKLYATFAVDSANPISSCCSNKIFKKSSELRQHCNEKKLVWCQTASRRFLNIHRACLHLMQHGTQMRHGTQTKKYYILTDQTLQNFSLIDFISDFEVGFYHRNLCIPCTRE